MLLIIIIINNMLEVNMYKRETYFHQLRGVLHHNTLEEYQSLIKRVIECRHQRILERQKSKFEVLYQQKTSGCSNMGGHSNHAINPGNEKSSSTATTTNNDQINEATDEKAEVASRWVKNLLSIPLTKDQESLLAHGPKFAISPKHPPTGEYTVAIEQACSKLNQQEAEELRVEVKKALKKTQRPPANITKDEYKAMNEIKEG